jgi:hypothetical protein
VEKYHFGQVDERTLSASVRAPGICRSRIGHFDAPGQNVVPSVNEKQLTGLPGDW